MDVRNYPGTTGFAFPLEAIATLILKQLLPIETP